MHIHQFHGPVCVRRGGGGVQGCRHRPAPLPIRAPDIGIERGAVAQGAGCIAINDGAERLRLFDIMPHNWKLMRANQVFGWPRFLDWEIMAPIMPIILPHSAAMLFRWHEP